MRVEDFNLCLGIVELVFGINGVTYRFEFDESATLFFHVDDPDHIPKIFENIVQAFIGIIRWN